ncbi:MAG: cupin-like domain-containing protein [Candidatus Acidiferrales bacterium]
MAKTLIDGESDSAIADALYRAGFAPETCAQEIKRIRRSPIFAGAVAAMRLPLKALSLFNALAELQRQRITPLRVLERPDPANFYDEYYSPNRAVILRGLTSHWPASKLWSPDYFASRFGDVTVEVSDGRNSELRYEDHIESHMTRCTLGELVRRCALGPSNDFYLVAKNKALSNTELAALLEDIGSLDGFVDTHANKQVSLWFGPAGTITPLHHDACPILFAQVFGRKRVRLVSPFELGRVRNDRHCYSDWDPAAQSTEPNATLPPVLEAELSPGDLLFIPLGYWHHVQSLTTSISLSFTRFIYPPVIWPYQAAELSL